MVKHQETRLEHVEEDLAKSSPLDGVFYASLILKGADGILEIIGAIIILIFNPTRINHLLDLLTHEEIAQRHHALFMTLSSHISHAYTNDARYFLVVYLLVHAAIKIVSVIGLLMNKRWAYPFALITLGILMLYQLYDIFFIKPSAFMIFLTIFDAFILWLIWREYKIRILNKKKKPTHPRQEKAS